MRVRPNRTSPTRRSIRRLHLGSGHTAPEAPAAPEPAPPAAPEPAPRSVPSGERRARDAGGPIDRAHYTCSCGFVFEAAVSTSVSCPHCGTGQAW